MHFVLWHWMPQCTTITGTLQWLIEKQPTAKVLTKLRTFLDLPSIDDDELFIVQKWIKLLANKLQVDGAWRLCIRKSFEMLVIVKNLVNGLAVSGVN
jgi:hypothetical protein